MKECIKKTMSIELYVTCVNDDYFDIYYRDYYDFIYYETKISKLYGSYVRTFYKLKPIDFFINSGLDVDLYTELPFYVCASKIY